MPPFRNKKLMLDENIQRNASNLPYFWNTKPHVVFWLSFHKSYTKWRKKTTWVFVFQKYENFEAFSNEHNPYISEGCMSFTHLEKDYLFIANVVVKMLTLKISPKVKNELEPFFLNDFTKSWVGCIFFLALIVVSKKISHKKKCLPNQLFSSKFQCISCNFTIEIK